MTLRKCVSVTLVRYHNGVYWAVHAQAARKVYEKVLGSLLSVPQQYKDNAAPLALALSRLESSTGSKEGILRAVHALAWLGGGGAFTPLRGAPTAVESSRFEH